MPIEKFASYNIISTAFTATAVGSTKIVTGATNRAIEVVGYWINAETANRLTFVSDTVTLAPGGLSGHLFVADRGGSVNANPSGAYDINGRLIPWFSSSTSSALYINLLNAGSVSGTILYVLGS